MAGRGCFEDGGRKRREDFNWDGGGESNARSIQATKREKQTKTISITSQLESHNTNDMAGHHQ